MATLEMDPQAAWLLLLDALESGHWLVVRNQSQDLLEWINLGESPPSTNGKITNAFWNRHVAVYSCKLARWMARRHLRDSQARKFNRRGRS